MYTTCVVKSVSLHEGGGAQCINGELRRTSARHRDCDSVKLPMAKTP